MTTRNPWLPVPPNRPGRDDRGHSADGETTGPAEHLVCQAGMRPGPWNADSLGGVASDRHPRWGA